MTVCSTDPIETFSHFFSVLFSAATLNYYVKSKKNQALKEQVDVLSTEVLKETFTPEGVMWEVCNFWATMKTWQLVSLISWSPVLVQLKQITHRLNVLCAHQVEPVGNAIDEAKKYSYQFNVKIIGLPEMSSKETATETSSFCVKLFQEMGAEVSIFDIDTECIPYQQGMKAKVQNLWSLNFSGVWRKGKLWKFVNMPPKLTPQLLTCLISSVVT